MAYSRIRFEIQNSATMTLVQRNSLFNKQLLVIDDFGIEAMDDKTASDFLTVLEQRMGIRSLIIVGQDPIKQWHGQFSDPIKADAVMDRVINQSYIIELSGKSMREKYGAMARIRQEAEHAKNS